MMTTLDAPFWLRVAREYNEGIFKKEDNSINLYFNKYKSYEMDYSIKGDSVSIKYNHFSSISISLFSTCWSET